MGKKFSTGRFIPKNPKKYIGSHPITFRSSWEKVFMDMCDSHPDILQWASESVKIPYYNTFKQKYTVYVPDFIIKYLRNGKIHVELIEIKPMNQTIDEKARGITNRIQLAVNKAKWAAAAKWCKKHGMFFRIMTEADLFAQIGKHKPRKRKI